MLCAVTDVLRKPVQVAGAADRPGQPLRTIEAGTPVDEINPVELAQLHPDHFVNVDDDGARTGQPVAADLVERTTAVAAALRELDGSPGVDSTEHVDDPLAFIGHPDEQRQRAARDAEQNGGES